MKDNEKEINHVEDGQKVERDTSGDDQKVDEKVEKSERIEEKVQGSEDSQKVLEQIEKIEEKEKEMEKLKRDLKVQKDKMEQLEIDMIRNSPRRDYIPERVEGFFNYDLKAKEFIREETEREYQSAAKILDDILGHG